MEKTTTIYNAVSKIKRHPLLQDIPFETILDYLVDFIQIVGCPQLYEEKTAKIEIKDWRGLLPCDYINMIQVRDIHSNEVYRYTTDSFHMSPKHDAVPLTYKIQGSVIYTSSKNKNIEIAYHAIATDDKGYPLIPDNPSFIRAFNAYIKKEWFTILFDMGKIQPVIYNQALTDYAWAVGDCETEFHRMSLDKAEAFFNSWNTLIIRAREHSHGFKNDGDKEFLRLH